MKNQFSDKRKELLSYRSLRMKKGGPHRTDERLASLFDEGSFEEYFAELETADPLAFPGYRQKLQENRLRTGSKDAVTAGRGLVNGIPVFGAELGKAFLMGSMGTVAGEKLALSFEEADRQQLPLVIFSASGGARMQEGMFSLLQMAKTGAAARRFSEHGGFYISVLTHPTTGGVSASYASLGDVVLAEPGALIGFAGPRVIEQTIGEKLPAGFQRAEFQLEHGFVDRIVRQDDMKYEITRLLRLHGFGRTEDVAQATVIPDGGRIGNAAPEAPEPVLSAGSHSGNPAPESVLSAGGRPGNPAEDASGEMLPEDESGGSEAGEARKDAGVPGLSAPAAAERVRIARDRERPHIEDFIGALFEDFTALCGDRLGGEDAAILGGIGFLDGLPVTVIGHRKGRDLKENLACRFGMPEPSGYRKALRLMRQAEKFGRPVITFIDTPGASPDREAEENGQSAAIAENLAAMSMLRTPILTIVIGEGSSGGALAIGMGDRIWMLENAVYSVLSPEGFASILWKDASRSGEACEVMKLTAADLRRAGLADRVFPEPAGGLGRDPEAIRRLLKTAVRDELAELRRVPADRLVAERYEKYRHFEGNACPKDRAEGEKG